MSGKETFEMKVALGSHAKDVLTGFEGIVTSYTVHITGCDTVGLKSRELDKDGKQRDAEWFDVTRIEVLAAPPVEIQKVIDESKGKTENVRKGGPREECPERPAS